MPPISGNDRSLVYALAGVARAGIVRAGATSKKVFVKINDVQRAFNRPSAASRVFVDSLNIKESNSSVPNQASMRTMGFPVARRQEVVITIGSVNRLRREFGGVIIGSTERRLVSPAHVVNDIDAVDFGWLLNGLVTGYYTGTADAIAIELVQAFAPQFSTSKIQTGLPTVSGGISFVKVPLRNALDRLAERIGATWRADYRKRILFGTAAYAWRTNPQVIHSGLQTALFDDNFSISREVSQQITRVHCEGGGMAALADVSVGDTIIPLVSVPEELFGDDGGEVIIGDSQQVIAYTSRDEGGSGGLVGPGASPSSAPTITEAVGTGIEPGTHQWAVVFKVGSDSSLPSPLATKTLALDTTLKPSLAPVTSAPVAGGLCDDGLHDYMITWLDAFGNETATSFVSVAQSVVAASGNRAIPLTLQDGASWVASRNLYRRFQLAGTFKLVANLAATGNYTDGALNAALGADAPSANTVRFEQADITNVPIGPAGTTAREIYRTEAGQSQLKLQQTIANNTDTFGVTDSTPDASLGANAPTVDTSGLSQPSGQVLAGSTSLIVAGLGGFQSEGWAVVGNGTQVIRYTGVSSTALTGIPASGPGSITATVSYNSTVTAAPSLRGISADAIVNTILKGSQVNLWVTVDNEERQDAIAAIVDPTDLSNGLAGIIADVISDGRIGREEAIARATARLDSQDDENATLTITSLDGNARAGTDLSYDDGSSPTVLETLKLQDVDISWVDADPPIMPTRSLSASSKRFTFEEVLQRAREAR